MCLGCDGMKNTRRERGSQTGTEEGASKQAIASEPERPAPNSGNRASLGRALIPPETAHSTPLQGEEISGNNTDAGQIILPF